MKTLEIIHLRLAGERPRNLAEIIRRSAGPELGWIRIRIYEHYRVSSDLAIHIRKDAVGPGPDVSDVGIRLASMLREYGMVEHSVWTECPVVDKSLIAAENGLKTEEG
jgi:hypothetical protein